MNLTREWRIMLCFANSNARNVRIWLFNAGIFAWEVLIIYIKRMLIELARFLFGLDELFANFEWESFNHVISLDANVLMRPDGGRRLYLYRYRLADSGYSLYRYVDDQHPRFGDFGNIANMGALVMGVPVDGNAANENRGGHTGDGASHFDPYEIAKAKEFLINQIGLLPSTAYHQKLIFWQILNAVLGSVVSLFHKGPDMRGDAIKVAILDSRISCRYKLLLRERFNDKVRIFNKQGLGMVYGDAAHCDAVVEVFIQELVRIYGGIDQLPAIDICVYNVVTLDSYYQKISLYNVLRALENFNEIVDNNRMSYVNMSFVFSNNIQLLLREFIDRDNITCTCAAGNYNREINGNAENISYPSMFGGAIDSLNPVIGHRGIVNENLRIWQDPRGQGSSYPSAEEMRNQDGLIYYAGDALLAEPELGGGTSFAAPRVLAQLIAENAGLVAFGIRDVVVPESNIGVVQAQVVI